MPASIVSRPTSSATYMYQRRRVDDLPSSPTAARSRQATQKWNAQMAAKTRAAHPIWDAESRVGGADCRGRAQKLDDERGHRDHRGDRAREAGPVEVEAAQRGRALEGIARGETLRKPEMHAPNRERDDGHRGEDGELAAARLGGRIVEGEQQDGAAQQHQTDGQNHQRGGAHQVEVEPPQNHRRNRTTMRG